MNFKSAVERDREWLKKHGLELDAELFSKLVDRLHAQGWIEPEARMEAAQQLEDSWTLTN